jgi:hypothetical protein
MTQQTNRTHARRSGIMAVAAAALAALTPLGNADPGDFSDGYLEIRIVNHPNNTPDLGELYIYVASYDSPTLPTDIPLLPGSAKFTGAGYYENGTGVTYKVKDLPQSGQLGNGSEWHGFRINQPAAAGMGFVLGFGCDERHSVSEGNVSYSQLYAAGHGDPGGCISYDAPTGAAGASAINWGSTYDSQKGFGQRCAAFEVAYFCDPADCSGNGDQGDLTNINYYGFPMNVEGSYCSTENGNWTQQEFGGAFGTPTSSKRYIRNDQWIRNTLKALMINGDGTSNGDNWYYHGHEGVPSSFVRAVSPQKFPNTQNPGWHPVPSAFTFSPGYLAHLYSTYPCGGEGFAIEGPCSAAEGHDWTSAAGAFKAEACFESADSLKIHDFTHLESAVSILLPPNYEITCTIPSSSAGDGWTHMEHFVLSGDPGGSSATVTVTLNGQPVLTNHPMATWDYLIDGQDYTDAIKGAFRQASTAIQFGWLGNTTKVTDTHVGPSMAENYIYLEAHDGVEINTLSTGKMQYIEPIYAWENGNEWFDRYGETMLLAQNRNNMVTYVSGYSDTYSYGQVQFKTHSDKFNRITLTIPDLTPACYSDFNNDGSNDREDILILMGDWGKAGCDLTGDTPPVTNVHDLLKLLADWGECTRV